MLKEIEQTHIKVMSNTEAYRIQCRMLESLYSSLHYKLQGLPQADREFGRAVDPEAIGISTRLSKYQKARPTTGGSSLWERYWTAIVVEITSALVTNIISSLLN